MEGLLRGGAHEPVSALVVLTTSRRQETSKLYCMLNAVAVDPKPDDNLLSQVPAPLCLSTEDIPLQPD